MDAYLTPTTLEVTSPCRALGRVENRLNSP
jgi:hypothetical protein